MGVPSTTETLNVQIIARVGQSAISLVRAFSSQLVFRLSFFLRRAVRAPPELQLLASDATGRSRLHVNMQADRTRRDESPWPPRGGQVRCAVVLSRAR